MMTKRILNLMHTLRMVGMPEQVEVAVLEPLEKRIKGYKVFRYVADGMEGGIYYRSNQSGTWCGTDFRDVVLSLDFTLQSLYREMYPDALPAEIKAAVPRRGRPAIRKPYSGKYAMRTADIDMRINRLMGVMEWRYHDPGKGMAIRGEKARFLRWMERRRPDFMESYKMQNRASRTTTFYKDIEKALKRRGEMQKAA